MQETIKNLVTSNPRRTVFILLITLALLMQVTFGIAVPEDTGPW